MTAVKTTDDSKVHDSSTITNDDLLKQQDPAQLLVNVLVQTNDKLINIQSSTSLTEEYWAEGASNAVLVGDTELQKLADGMKDLSGEDLTKASSEFQVMQTQTSNTDQNYNNIVTGGAQVMNSGTQVMAQELKIGDVAITQKDSTNNLLAGWANY